jgi:hypothetical protein
MQDRSPESLKRFCKWAKSLPHAKATYPDTVSHKVKYFFWKYYTPYHASVRDTAMSLRVVRHVGRQEFLLGHVHPEVSFQDITEHLVAHGFGAHSVAWKDDGEILSLRRVLDFEFQYHLRLFEDGEIRGHFEYTPECYPIRHLNEEILEPRTDYFLEILGEKIIRVRK